MYYSMHVCELIIHYLKVLKCMAGFVHAFEIKMVQLTLNIPTEQLFPPQLALQLQSPGKVHVPCTAIKHT